jgi:phosphoribosyl 1,2-cyclic phosphodiesterase
MEMLAVLQSGNSPGEGLQSQRDSSEQDENSTLPSAGSPGSNPGGQLKIAILATSSAGNSSFVSDGVSRLLIDCGLSLLETTTRLAAIGESVDNIDAVLLSHPHGDHCAGLPTLIKRWRRGGRCVPVYCSVATFDALPNVIPPHWYRHVAQFDHWQIGEIRCETFVVQHDCGEPLGFTVQVGDQRATFALDLGAIDDPLAEYFTQSDFLLLESNHDPDMLAAGPYSYRLKQRIAKTHLSNESACAWISEYMGYRTRYLLLGHLSETTNDPAIVRLMAQHHLTRLKLTPVFQVISPGASSGPWLLAPLARPGPGKE